MNEVLNGIIGVVVIVGLVYWFARRKWKPANDEVRKPVSPAQAPAKEQPGTPVKPAQPAVQPIVPDRKPEPAPPAAKPKSPHQLRREKALTMEVKLAGTSFKGRQGYLRKIDEEIEPFSYCSYGINQTEYKGEPAFEVFADMMGETSDKVLGMVPAAKVKKVLEIYERIFEVGVYVYGGPEYDGDEKSYGASATFYYE